jgi:hypothetical protein
MSLREPLQDPAENDPSWRLLKHGPKRFRRNHPRPSQEHSAHVETCGQLDLSEMGGLAKVTELEGTDPIEHAALMGV